MPRPQQRGQEPNKWGVARVVNKGCPNKTICELSHYIYHRQCQVYNAHNLPHGRKLAWLNLAVASNSQRTATVLFLAGPRFIIVLTVSHSDLYLGTPGSISSQLSSSTFSKIHNLSPHMIIETETLKRLPTRHTLKHASRSHRV